jgi:hypothetical protein
MKRLKLCTAGLHEYLSTYFRTGHACRTPPHDGPGLPTDTLAQLFYLNDIAGVGVDGSSCFQQSAGLRILSGPSVYSASAQNISIQNLLLTCRSRGLCSPFGGTAPQLDREFTGRFVRKGSQIAHKGVSDLLLEGRGAVPAQAAEPPESPVFCGAKNAPK